MVPHTNPTRQRGLFVLRPSLARRVSVGLFILLGVLVSTAHGAPYSYATHALQLTDLGAGVNPQAINSVGQVVGQAANNQAFMWQGGITTPLGTVGGTQSFANDISDNGWAVGWSLDAAGHQKAFRWDATNGMTNIGATVTADSAAEAINNLDQIIGWRTNGTAWKTTLWDFANPNGTTLFGTQGDHKGLGINDAGYVVGITLGTGGVADEGYYWDGFGGITSYNSEIGVDYFPYAGINQSKLTAGINAGQFSFYTIGVNLFAISAGKISPSDAFSLANGLNDVGQLVGESGNKGALYDLSSQALFDLNLFPRHTPGFGQVLRLTDINNDGKFVGVALVDGIEHGIVGQLVPVPEPSSLVLLAIGAAAMILFFTGPMRQPQKSGLPRAPRRECAIGSIFE